MILFRAMSNTFKVLKSTLTALIYADFTVYLLKCQLNVASCRWLARWSVLHISRDARLVFKLQICLKHKLVQCNCNDESSAECAQVCRGDGVWHVCCGAFKHRGSLSWLTAPPLTEEALKMIWPFNNVSVGCETSSVWQLTSIFQISRNTPTQRKIKLTT